MAKIIPLGERVLVRPFTEAELKKKDGKKSKVSFILPDSMTEEKSGQGKVVAVGEAKKVKVGDVVFFSRYAYDQVEVEGEEFSGQVRLSIASRYFLRSSRRDIFFLMKAACFPRPMRCSISSCTVCEYQPDPIRLPFMNASAAHLTRIAHSRKLGYHVPLQVVPAMAYLPYIQVVLALLLVGGVLLQRSEAGLGAGFGGEGSYGTRFTRRGVEKLLFQGTVLVAILFCLAVLAPLFLSR